MAVMNTESEHPAGRRSRYPKEFRRDAAAPVIDQHRTVDIRFMDSLQTKMGRWVTICTHRTSEVKTQLTPSSTSSTTHRTAHNLDEDALLRLSAPPIARQSLLRT